MIVNQRSLPIPINHDPFLIKDGQRIEGRSARGFRDLRVYAVRMKLEIR